MRARLAAASVSRLSAQSPDREVVRMGTGSCAGTGRLGSAACGVIASFEGGGGAEVCGTGTGPTTCRVAAGLAADDSLRISARVLPGSSGGGGNTEACLTDCQWRNRRQPTQPKSDTTATQNSAIQTSLGINRMTTKAPSNNAPIPPPFPLRRPILGSCYPLAGNLPPPFYFTPSSPWLSWTIKLVLVSLGLEERLPPESTPGQVFWWRLVPSD